MDECCLPVPCSCDCAQPMPTHWIAEWTDDEGQRWRQRLGIKAPGSDVPGFCRSQYCVEHDLQSPLVCAGCMNSDREHVRNAGKRKTK